MVGGYCSVPSRKATTADRRLFTSLMLPTCPQWIGCSSSPGAGMVEQQLADALHQVLCHQVGVLVGGFGGQVWFLVAVGGHRVSPLGWWFGMSLATVTHEPCVSRHIKRSFDESPRFFFP